jgi:hypothetical protein
MPDMQIDSEEVEELSERILKVINDYMPEVRELNASEVSLALGLVFHKLWKDSEGGEAGSEESPAAANPPPAPEPRPAAPAPRAEPPRDEGQADDAAIDSFLDG